MPPPRLGVSGLYTDYMERRKYSGGDTGSISPAIPSPPPPVTTSTLERLRSKASGAFPIPPPAFPYSNGHINMVDMETKKSAVDMSNELNRCSGLNSHFNPLFP